MVELLLAIALSGAVLVVLGHMTRQYGVAVGNLDDSARLQTRAALAVMQMRSELRVARTILSLTSREVTFVHPDVNEDAQSDVVKYSWSGIAGEPLMRTWDGMLPEALLDDCRSFSITAVRGSTAMEEILSGHYMYDPSVNSVRQNYTLSGASRAAEVFTVTTSRSEAAAFRVTRVQLFMQPVAGTGNFSVALQAAPGGTPTTPNLDAVSMPVSQLSSGGGWEECVFSGNVSLNLGSPYAMVLATSASISLAYDQIYVGAPPTSADYFRWSSNGSTWEPSSDLGARDLRYKVVGQFLNAAGEPLPPIPPVIMLELHVEAGSGVSRAQFDAAVHCLESPEAPL